MKQSGIRGLKIEYRQRRNSLQPHAVPTSSINMTTVDKVRSMNRNDRSGRLSSALLILVATACATSIQATNRNQNSSSDPPVAAQPVATECANAIYESPVTLKASKLLPRDLLSGPDYKIEENVVTEVSPTQLT